MISNFKPNNEILDIDNEETLEHTQMEVPCIIFLDSLKAHQKNVVAGNVRRWLNHEWKKIKGGETDVFNKQSIKLFAPKGIGLCCLCVCVCVCLISLLNSVY